MCRASSVARGGDENEVGIGTELFTAGQSDDGVSARTEVQVRGDCDLKHLPETGSLDRGRGTWACVRADLWSTVMGMPCGTG